MRVRLRTRVQVEDAVFYFAGGDHALPAALGACAAYCRTQPEGPVEIDPDNMPWQILPPLADLFTEACVAWEKVVDDETGEPLPFSPQARAEMPPEVKALVASQFLAVRQDLVGEASRPAAQDTPAQRAEPTSGD